VKEFKIVRFFALYLQKIFQIVLVFSGGVCSAQTREKRAGVFGVISQNTRIKGGNYYLEGFELLVSRRI